MFAFILLCDLDLCAWLCALIMCCMWLWLRVVVFVDCVYVLCMLYVRIGCDCVVCVCVAMVLFVFFDRKCDVVCVLCGCLLHLCLFVIGDP